MQIMMLDKSIIQALTSMFNYLFKVVNQEEEYWSFSYSKSWNIGLRYNAILYEWLGKKPKPKVSVLQGGTMP